MKTHFTFALLNGSFMIRETKQAKEQKVPLKRPLVQVQTKAFVPDYRAFFTNGFLLFLIAVTLLLSLSSDQLFIKELTSSGIILSYVFTVQLMERKAWDQ